mmetsp:Transcript_30485/g.85349  ORF Transcript_30485/g.85349 Transcript_30485/m.85349 type:complete len:334 (+) Transcript_30485:1185-2186(+)
MAFWRSWKGMPPSMRHTRWPLTVRYDSMRSSIFVIWLKNSTLCPPGRSLFRRRSIRQNLPHCSTSSWGSGYVKEPSYPPWMRSGWLQFLRICISMLLRLPMSPRPPLVFIIFAMASLSVRSTSCLFSSCCILDMSAYSKISFLLGRDVSTSDLMRRRRKGFRIWCNLVTTRLLCSWATISASLPSSVIVPKSNQDSKSLKLVKMSGSRKFKRLQSSARLFCKGVPVSKSLFALWMDLSSRRSLQSKFFSRCPSSTTMYFHMYLCRKGRSRITISYEVTMTGNFSSSGPVGIRVVRRLARSSCDPWYRMQGMEGQNFSNSFTQFGSVESGPTMR